MKNIYSNEAADECNNVLAQFFLNTHNVLKSITFCISVFTFSFHASAQTVVISDNDVTCHGASNGDATANVSGGTAPYTYLWNNGQTVQTISGLSVGVYSVTITDALNNTAEATTIVSQPPIINKSVDVTDVTCNGQSDGAISLTVSGGIPPYTYDWDNDGIGDNDDPEDLVDIPAGVYNVTITDALGCSTDAEVTVHEEPPIVAVPLVTNVACPGDSTGEILLLVTGGGDFYSFDWDTDGTGDFDDPKNISNLTAGLYSVTIRDVFDCTHMVSGQVTEPAIISPNAIVTDISCAGLMDAAINLTPSGGTAPYTFIWDNNLGTIEDVSGLGIGTYTVTITDDNNCIATEAYAIAGQAVLTATTTKVNASCNNSSDGSIDLTVTGGTTPYSFLWSNGMTIEDPTNLPVGGYTVTVTDANGCTQITNSVINSPAPITATALPNDASCFGSNNGSLDITAIGGTTPYTYVWSNGATFEDLFGIPAGTYSVVITDVNGCTGTETFTIGQPAQMSLNLGADENVCLGNSTTLMPAISGGNPPYVFSWDNGLGFGPSKTVTPTTTTIYSVTVTDDSGCTAVDDIMITVNTCAFDLALTKTLASGQPANVAPGDTVAFEITVINQGQVDANNISILDYIDLNSWMNFSNTINPNGVTTGSASLNFAWTTVGTDVRALIAGTIPAGATISLPINLVVQPGVTGFLSNEAEIYTDNNDDIDSQPESEEGDQNGDVLVNNEVNNAGGDEDDHDLSSVTASIYDLAINKQLATGQATTASPGDKVDFLITLYNQGTIAANNIQLIDYIDINFWNNFSLADNPVGVTGGSVSLNYAWSFSGPNAIVNIIGNIPPGQSITIPVSLTIKNGVTGTLYNWIEVFQDNGDDIDSQTENEENNGFSDVNIDDIIDNTGGDIDDLDGATIVSEMYDIALKKELAAGQAAAVESGSVVEFLITIYNQGTLPAAGIEIIDYIDLSDWDPFDLSLNPNGTTGGNVSTTYTFSNAGTNGLATINGAIPGNSTVTFPIYLKVKNGVSGLLYNYAEIYNDNGNDIDSQPEFEEVDLNGDVLVDDVIDNTSGDEDDHDVAEVTAFIYDIALRKEIAPTQNVNVDAGELVTFNITVFNQGDVPANNIRVIDYVDPAMWTAFNLADNLAGTTTGTAGLTYSWANSAGILQATISGAIPAGGQVTFPINLTTQNNICGWIDNYAEIYEDDGFDIDSQPEFWENDMNADTLINDVINNAAGDEDDHDIASVYVNKFDLALTKTLAGGQPSTINIGDNITFTYTITNQGDVDAYNINLIDYIPTGMTLVDPAWTASGPNATYNIVGPIIGNGGVATVNITLNAGAGFTGTLIENCGEIVSASDIFGGAPVFDFDSTADNNPNNDGDVIDNNINNDSGDEDDHDCEIANVRQAFDLALIKQLGIGQASPVSSGDTVTFTITTINQGITPAYDVSIIDYIPTGLNFINGLNPGWALGANNTATYQITGPIAAIGGTNSVDISFLVDPAFQDSCAVNTAEILFATDTPGGNLVLDADSYPNNVNNDVMGADNEVNGANGDEDDHDIEKIYINRFDMALRKTTNQISPVEIGDDVTFTITVFNQGNVPLQNIDVIDYIPQGLGLSPLDNNNWMNSGGDVVNTITSIVNPGDSTSIDITLRVLNIAAGGVSINYAEIFGFDDLNMIDRTNEDVDSNGDMIRINDVIYNDIIDNTLSDEDDHDSEFIIVEVFDLAMIKKSNVIMPMSGDTITYDFTVYNQGILNAFDVDIIDYLTSDFIFDQTLNPTWTIGSMGTVRTTIDGPILPGDSATVSLTVQIHPAFYDLKLVNAAEIADATSKDGNPTKNDLDSTPDVTNNDVVGGDDIIDNSFGDEDDHDVDTIMINHIFDLAAIKTANQSIVNLGDTLNFFIGIINQGTLPAYDISVVDYLPPSLTFIQNGITTWTNNGNGQYTTLINGPILPDATAQVFMSVRVDQSFSDMMLRNLVEIQSASTLIDGPVISDVDSNFDNIPNNDIEGGDNIVDNTDNDEDDHDWVKVIVCFDITDVAFTNPTNCGIANGSIAITTTNTASILEYSINNGGTWQTANVFNGVPDGVHHILVRYPGGDCLEDYGEITLTIPDTPIIDSVDTTDPTDCDASDGTITVNSTNATGMNFSIDGGTTWQSSNIFVNLAPGDYDVVMMNATFSCADNYGIVTINTLMPPTLVSAAGVNPTDCNAADGNITINANGGQGIEYSIDNEITWQTSSIFSNLAAGTYEVVIRNMDGTCSVNHPTPIELMDPVQPSIEGILFNNPTDCSTDDGTITIDASSASNLLEISIDGGATWQTNGFFTALPAGIYNVIVRNTDGTCALNYENNPVELIAPTVMVDVNMNDTTICLGNSFDLSVTATGTPIWEVVTGDATSLSCTNCANPTATPTYATTYKVYVGTEGTNCYDEEIVTINTENPILYNPIQTHKICLDEESLALQMSVPIDTFYITGTGNYSNAVILGDMLNFDIQIIGGSSDFTVELVSVYGCSVVNTFTVSRKVLFTPDFTMPTAACEGEDVNIEYTGGAPANSFLNWGLDGGNIIYSNPGDFNTPAGSDMVVNWPTPGLKTVTLTINYDGCFVTDTMTIDIGAYMAIASPDTSICLGNSANLNVTAGATYQWSPAGSLDDATIQNPVATPTTTTTYSVTVTDANGCSGVDETTVTVNNISPTITANPTICLGESVTLNATGGITYAWSPSIYLDNPNVSNPVATPLVTTTYTVTVTDANNCSAQLPVAVFVSDNPVVGAGNDVNICSGDNASLSATGAYSYVWTPNMNLSNPNIANPIATPTVTTTYYVTGTDSNGCSAIDSVIVNVFDGQLVSTIEDVILCGDQDMASVSIVASDNITNYTITSNTGSFMNDVSSGGTLTFDATATGFPSDFYIELTTTGDCIVRDTFTITKNPLLTADFAVQSPICIGENININYTGGGGATSFLNWNLDGAFIVNSSNAVGSPAFSDLVVQWSTGGTKTLVLSVEEFGCTVLDTVMIEVGDVTANVTPNSDICMGDSIQLVATGGVTYQWSPVTGLSDPNIANPIASPTSSTFYSVTVSDAQGCSDEISTVVTILFMGSTVIADQTICEGESVELFATGGTNYQWSPATGLNDPTISNPIASPTVTTTYDVIVTDDNNCSSNETVTVFVNPAPAAYAGLDTDLCIGEKLTLNASGGVSYSWSPAASLSGANTASPIASPSVTTTYTVTVTDALGCTATDDVTVFIKDGYLLQPIQDITLCDDVTTANVTVAISDTIQSYTIAGTGNYNNDITNFNFLSFDAILVAYPSDFYIEMITDGGCIVRDTFVLNKNQNLTANFTVASPVCVGENININYAGGATVNSFLTWDIDGGAYVSQSPATATDPAGSDIVVNWATGGTKQVILTIQEAGCTIADTMNIVVGDVMASVTPNSTICPGDAIQLVASGGVSYQWNPSDGLSNPNIANPMASPATSTFYTVTVTDDQGCFAEVSTVVTLHFTNTSIIEDQTICEGESVGLFATGGTTYLWSPAIGLDNPNSSTPNASPTTTTTYTVTITDTNNCELTEEVTVFVNPAPNADAGPDVDLCIGKKITLNATGGVSYNWSPASSLSGANTASPIASPLVTTTYTVTVTDAIGCTATDFITVYIHDGYLLQPIPDITLCNDDLSANVTVVISDTIQNYSITGNGGFSNDGVTDNSLNFDATMGSFPSIFYVEMTTDAGCMVNDTFYIFKNEGLTAAFDVETPACVGDIINISYGGGASVNSFLSWDIDGGIYISQSPPTATSPAGSDIEVQWGTGGIKNVVLTITESGCVVSDTVQVNVGDINAVAGPNVTVCPGDSTQLTASGGTIYSWSPIDGLSNPNIANPMASPAASTFYTVTVTDASGCTDEATTIVTLSFTAGTVSSDILICEGDSTMLSAAGGLAYSWSPTVGLSDPNIATPIAKPTTTTTYTVSITSPDGCITQHDVTVTVQPAPQTNFVINPPFCSGNNLSISYVGNAGPTAILNWDLQDGTLLSSSDATATQPAGNDITATWGGATGTKYISLIVTENGCSNADSVGVFLTDGPLITISSDTIICGGETVQLTATGGANYQWTPTIGLDNPAIGNPIASPMSTTTYSVLVTDLNGCESIAAVTIEVDNNNAAAGPDEDICVGESVQLNASGGVTYQWSAEPGLDNYSSPNPTATPSITTLYAVTITNANNCESVDYVLVTVHPNTIANAGNDVATCENSPVQLTATGGTSYVWTPTTGLSDPSIANPIATPSTTTIYTVTASNTGGCSSTDQVEVTVNPGFTLDVVTNPTHCCERDGDIEVTPIGGTGPFTYTWSPLASTSNVAIKLDFGFYTITVTDATGCTQVVTTEVGNDCDCELLSDDVVYVDSATVYTGCLPLPYDSISNYNIWQNGVPYTNSLFACDVDTIILYSYALINGMGNNGPYFVESWSCANGQVFSGLVQDMNDLTDSMNVWDPTGDWIHNPATFSIIGGDINDTYADILIRHIGTNITATLQTNTTTYSSSTAITAGTPGGDHIFIIQDEATCCVDTLYVYESSPCPALTATATTSPANCCDENGGITIDVNGGSAPYNYSWSGNISSTNEATNLASGIYNITITDTNGCFTEISSTVVRDCTCPDIYPEEFVSSNDGQAELCIPIVPAEMPNYTVTLDGILFDSFTGCNDDTLVYYTYAVLTGLGSDGPYTIDSWVINGVMHTATILTMDELADSMNAWDPFATWMNNPSTFTISTMDGTVQNYSNMQVTHVNTSLGSTMQTNSLETPFNSEMVINGEGEHIVTISPNGDCCTDTIIVNIGNCLPIFNGPYDIELDNCDTTAVFCTGIAGLQLQGYTLLDNGVVYADPFAACEEEPITIYGYGNLPSTGISFNLNSWEVDGNIFTGAFNSIEDLVDLLNELDVNGNWMLDANNQLIIGGNIASNYGDLAWTEVTTNQNGVMTPFAGTTTSDAGLILDVGTHLLTFTETATGCEEMVTVNVSCPDQIDTLYVFTTVELGGSNFYCVSNLNLPGTTTSVVNTCPDNSGNEADFTIDQSNFCVYYDGLALGQDTACLLICNDLGVCQPVCLVTIVTNDCQDFIGQEQINIMSASCDMPMEICIDGFGNELLNDFVITNNEEIYSGSIGNCDFQEVIAYSVKSTSGGNGPYQVDAWSVNGVLFTGTANSFEALADSMSIWDSISGWTHDAAGEIIYGGNINNTYTNLIITDLNIQFQFELVPTNYNIPNGTKLYLNTGNHELIFTENTTGCSDTVNAFINCISPDIYLDTLFIAEIDTICLDTMELPGNVNSITNYCDDGVGVNVEFTIIGGQNCIVTNGISIGLDSACVVLCDDMGYCDTTFIYIAVEQNLVTDPVLTNDVDSTELNTPIIIDVVQNDTVGTDLDSIYVLLPPQNGSVDWVGNGFEYTPNEGYCNDSYPDEFSYVICNTSGCDTAQVQVFVLCEDLVFYTGFSPNGDGINETFTIIGLERYPDNRLRVFNRWGEQVHYSIGYQNDWDGTWQGEGLPDGTYFYVFVSGRGKRHSGYVQINR